MSSGSRLLLVGLRGSGKTSYLAALWHLIEAGEIPTSLASSQLQPDRQYLNRIRDSWLTFQQVGRTSLRSPETVSLLLRDAATNANIHITLPDLSGELFRLQWVTRRAALPYAQFAADCSGILLLIHPAGVKRGSRIPWPDEFTPAKEAEHPPQPPTQESSMAATTDVPREWSHDLSPTQVQLVELLQFVAYLRSTIKAPRVAVIVSAWDLVRDPIVPASWLESHFPLLFQFLVANADTVPFRVYGVSALGGDLEKDLKQLQDQAVPSHRIRVIDSNLPAHSDLTAPIRFLLALDCDDPGTQEQ
jgi:ABC-type dipeptide/oligopeptide/nickel transport system ATPase subunit